MIGHSLMLGALELVHSDSDPWTINVVAEGTDWGSPEAVLTTIQSLIEDGEKVSIDHWGNRTIPVVVRIGGANSGVLAAGEAALTAELYKPNTLTWTPADGWGPPTVWDVQWSEMGQVPGDLAEAPGRALLHRTFAFTLTCAPFSRPETEVVSEAVLAPNPSDPASHVTVDNCSSTAAWGLSTAAVTDIGAALHVAPFPSDEYALWQGAAVPVGDNRFLVVDTYGAFWGRKFAYAPGGAPYAELSLLAQFPSPDHAGYTRLMYDVSAFASIGALAFYGTPAGEFDLRDIFLTDQPPHFGSLHQKALTLPVGGTMRTPGKLAVESETDGLGVVAAYTCMTDVAGYQPSMRTRRVSGDTANTDATAISGSKNSLTTGDVYEVPLSDLPPGQYQVWARLRSDSTAASQSVDQWASVDNGVLDNIGEVSNFTSIAFAAVNTWQMNLLWRVTLPPALTPEGSTSKLRFKLKRGSATSTTIQIDELLLYNLDIGRLTIANCGARKRLRLDAPTTALTKPAVFVADQADFSDGYYLDDQFIMAFGQHQFTPPSVKTHVATTVALDAATRLYHYPRFHTHVAKQGDL